MIDRVSQIDPLKPGRSQPANAQRQRDRQLERDRDQKAGYDQLTALCQLGEPEMAAQLAWKNPQWGYQIIDGTVMVQDETSEL